MLAIAVAATILVDGGRSDRISEIWEYSILNSAPLHELKGQRKFT